MNDRPDRARRPSAADSCGVRSPRTPDSIEAMCASHGPVASDGRFAPGEVFGEWRIAAFIGRGGNGEVYCAEHVANGTPAALKVLVREDECAKARFAREARLLSELKSAAFPKFFEYGEANGCPYLVMELLEPGELPSGDRSVARFLRQMCGAVAELHALGYVHRDIKPSNILWRTVGRGLRPRRIGRARTPAAPQRDAVPVLADLGLVKAVATSDIGRPTADITIGGVGTPGYGAPEQMERGEATVESDIHALGVLADRCFGGYPPRAWARVIERATSSIPARRYPSAAAFARAIRHRNSRFRAFLAAFCFCLAAAACMAPRSVKSFGGRPDAADPSGGECPQAELVEPVLSATAVLNGAEAKDVKWFLDGNLVEMPCRFPKMDPRRSGVSFKWLRAVAKRDGKVYSAKEEGGFPVWNGEMHVTLVLREDPAAGTSIRMFSPGGVPFDFAWRPAGESADGSAGYGCWVSERGLAGRQLDAIIREGLLYKPFVSTEGFDSSSCDPLPAEWLAGAEIPDFSFPGVGLKMELLQDAQRGGGNPLRTTPGAETAAGDSRLVATSAFANETNTVLYCSALARLRSGDPCEIEKGEKMLLGFFESDDAAFAAAAREICIERGVATLDSCGAEAEPRFRRAAVRSGNADVLERLATTDPDAEIRIDAYGRIVNPPQMLSARYVSLVAEDFPGDIGEPIAVIGKMTDPAALEYVAGNAALEYFRDLAKDRLARVKMQK